MNKEQAVELINQVVKQVRLTYDEHQQIQVALKVLAGKDK